MNKIIGIILGLASFVIFAESSGEQLQKNLNAIRTMQADFTQKVESNHRIISKSTGRMALLRPGKFRWQTLSPMAQVIVADGDKLWIYDVDLEQVTVKKQDQGLGNTAALFLSGYNETLMRDFKIEKISNNGNERYRLKPINKESTYAQVELDFNKSTLIGLNLYDQLGQKTEVKLIHIQHNQKISPKLFVFTPPKGVDVVKQ